MTMICPKCRGDMRQYERGGVTVDQCTTCHGIFLDRGELEKIFEAEAHWESQRHGQPTPVAQTLPPPPPSPPGYGQPVSGYAQPAEDRHSHYPHRAGFLGELLG
ncbi:TFIIB-type zinc ribbon-containing protein [Rhizomonospora bruguierae]|uniref:TFIIB-type zinc ribbon-containing protein n=1 Tax=Rhizomonospora bruguierae TaxID=1581705 RepID=UPI001BD09103|nr:zf-TFIIB domain-containing protein [Micromonospora sp. NBRC 107566]